MALDVREIARRAVGRVLAERGERDHPRAHPTGAALSGVHVHVEPHAAASALAAPSKARQVVTSESLATIADGGVVAVPRNAFVTPLAREEAERRGILLQEAAPSIAIEPRDRTRVAVASDHGGFALKRDVLAWLHKLGAAAVDLGTRDENPVDYPDFASAVGEAVASGEVDLGICIDGAGIGSAMAANKVPGVRAANCHDAAMAKNAREHNFANVLTLGAKMVSRDRAHEVVRVFLATPHGEQRHAKRVEKIAGIERRYARDRAQA